MTPKTETPAALQAAGARNEIACHGALTSEHRAKQARWTTLVWCRASGSIERLRMVAEGLA
jgi:hypothetical protein